MFDYIKFGFKGVKIIQTCFCDVLRFPLKETTFLTSLWFDALSALSKKGSVLSVLKVKNFLLGRGGWGVQIFYLFFFHFRIKSFSEGRQKR